MYDLIKYSDNYSDSSEGLWGFKRDEIANNANVTNDDNGPSFKYKSYLIANTNANGTKKGLKIAKPQKYFNNCFGDYLKCHINNIWDVID